MSINILENKSNVQNNWQCKICLGKSVNLRLVNNEELYCYKMIVGQSFATEMAFHICIICGHLLRKFARFSQQCQRARSILYQAVQEKLAIRFHSFSTTPPKHEYIGPVLPDDDFIESYDNEGNEGSDEDVPLVMLKNDNKDEISLEEPDITVNKEESANVENQAKHKKPEKKIKEGFSSRMVQETEQYLVIKLTTEQVLKEMEEKRNSERYKRAQYKCELCAKGFNFEDVLTTHMERHSAEYGEFKCSLCLQYCPSAISLRGHMKSHTTRYKCKVCGDVRLSRQHLLEHHAITHTAAPTEYTCEHCYFTSNKRTVIQRHVKTHRQNEQYACEHCGRRFNNVEALRVHTARHDKSKALQCEWCPRKFIYPSLLATHRLKVHERADYYCVECDVRFKSPDNLRLHFKRAKRHRDASSYTHQCSQCPAKFFSSPSLAGHMAAAHGAPKSYCCEICSRLYSSRQALNGHIKRVHRDRPGPDRSCDICDRTFSRKSVLAIHMRTQHA